MSTSPTWLELLGSKNWDGLLNPPNDHLRQLILHCGDLCQVTYDTFINDQNSSYCGTSRYSKADLLQKTGFPGDSHRYKVVTFLYATAKVSVPEAFLLKSRSREQWDRESNWIGYVAVSSDEASKEMGRREIYVAWRGTTRDYEWVDVLGAQLQSANILLRNPLLGSQEKSDQKSTKGSKSCFLSKFLWAAGDNKGADSNNDSDSDNDDNEKPKVMRGWLTVYSSDDPKSPFTKLSARTQLLTKLNQLINHYKDEQLSITFTGHSLGATLSVVSAFDVAHNLKTKIPISAFVFGCPKVGNKAFKDKFNAYPNLKVLHIRNVIDLIPHYPLDLMGYVNVGTELEIDTRKSSFLKDSKNPSDWHNLQAMLHVVNGWQGTNAFKLNLKRSIALVNKSCDFLQEECLVPASWWVEKNKGMVLDNDGQWILARPEEEPVPEFD